MLLLAFAGWLGAHDLFLKPDAFFVSPGETVTVRVLNGTFSKSENAVARNRLRDISLVTPEGVTHPDTSEWDDRSDTTTAVLRVRMGRSGTYVIGASIKPRELKLEAKDFNAYLASDGVPDVLRARRRDKELDRPARERYHKHVKALVQVGDARSEGYQTVLDYPAELVPLDNPYALEVGSVLRVRALVEGQPVANQLVVSGGRTPSGGRIAQRSVRTDSTGAARIRIGTRGAWYVKFIHMERATADTTIDYESKWATLTFGVR
ncbi:MAG: DUF4198 domain-containing protein [Gemmatimonadaceae bacterium]